MRGNLDEGLLQIATVEMLVEELKMANKSQAAQLIKRIEIPAEAFANYATWNNERYTRNCLALQSHFELILLCWEPGNKTPLHCHAEQECWVYGVEGEVTEIRYAPNELNRMQQSNFSQLNGGEMTYMHDRMGYHIIENNSTERAMTLHLYMNPIKKCRIFDVETGAFEWKTLRYDSFEGKLVA
ncbi:MAG: cysteine dioxygenase family protein [Bacteroidetes bacterium]|nr:cysteine dioxygenase family protein [Bacteroidota bacterium]